MPPSTSQTIGIAAVFLFLSHPLYAQTAKNPQQGAASSGMTANELFAHAGNLFNQKNYDGALEAYLKFKADFSSSPDIAKALHSSFYPIAFCCMRQGHFDKALPAIREALDAQPPLSAQQIQELTFWLGISELQQGDFPAAREAFEKFIALFPAGNLKNPLYLRQNPAAAKIPEAGMLIGTSLIMEGKFREAADYHAKLKPSLAPEFRGRAVVFQLHSMLESGDKEAAMQVVAEEFPHMEEIPQLISFQRLTLQLGNLWLENGEFRKAIFCLQRVWTRDRLLKHQEQRLAILESQLAAPQIQEDSSRKLLCAKIVDDVRRETESFRNLESFDASLRLRLATAYLQMKRYREAALVMESMVAELPPDKITEQAAWNLIRCWNALEDWPETIEAAGNFVIKFPDSTLVPQVLLMQAEAMRSSLRHEEAAAAFSNISGRFPNSESAPRALFLKAFSLLQAEKNAEAATAFEDFLSRHPAHALADDGAYWLGMTHSFDKQFGKCRDLMNAYLAKHPKGLHRGAAVFRKAYCSQQLERYGTAIDELHAYLEQFPGEPENSEALILLGNALMNEGFVPEGIAAFQKIPSTGTKAYEEGVFRTAEALKLLEQYDQYHDLMQGFAKNHPRSPRVAEAITNLGWYHRQKEKPEKAREIHWQALREWGNDPEIRSVEDMFPALGRLYRGPSESAEYLALLDDMISQAEAQKKTVLLTRLLHAQAAAFKKTDASRSNALLLQAAGLADVRQTNPSLLVDFGNALLEAGQKEKGEEMLRDALRWNPRAVQKDRILAALGDIEMKKGNDKAALDWFDRFERENVGTNLFGPTMVSKARILQKRGRLAEARRALEEVLKNESTSGERKAEALCMVGDIHMAEKNPKLAIPYYQRVYVMHGRWKPWVAKAYARSGEAFEKLEDAEGARRTYIELLSHPDLEDFSETAAAKTRLQTLGGALPSKKFPNAPPPAEAPDQG